MHFNGTFKIKGPNSRFVDYRPLYFSALQIIEGETFVIVRIHYEQLKACPLLYDLYHM